MNILISGPLVSKCFMLRKFHAWFCNNPKSKYSFIIIFVLNVIWKRKIKMILTIKDKNDCKVSVAGCWKSSNMFIMSETVRKKPKSLIYGNSGRLWWERATNSLSYVHCHYEWWSWDSAWNNGKEVPR